MFDPQKVLALNNTIGLLVVAAMNPEQPDFEALLGDFRLCLNNYEAWAESFWTGRMLEVEQVFTVGNEVRLSAPKHSTTPVSSTVATCPASGPLTLVHMFEAARFVPIGNTPVKIEPLLNEGQGEPQYGAPIHATIGPSGILEIPDCWRGQRHRITFFPNVSAAHVKALYDSYQDVVGDLEGWLRNEWETEFQPLWVEFSGGDFKERYRTLQRADWHGFEKSLHGLWDDIKQVYALVADLQANSEKLLEYLTEAELATLLNASSEVIANLLLVLGDEPLMFIYLAAFTSWLKMLPPQYIAEVVAQIRTEILIGFLLACLTGPAGLKLGLSTKVLNKIKSARARRWLAAASLRLAELTARSDLSTHAGALKPLMVSARNAPLRPAPAVPLLISATDTPVVQVQNPVAIARKKTGASTRLGRHEHRDDVSSQAKNPNGDSADTVERTATNKCPVSMVTGEELLTLTDGTLDGLLPFDFTRLYRTSAVELDSGLGFGWSHSLSQRLELDGEQLLWIDAENRRTPFPRPTAARPVIHNSLSRAAIYLGEEPDELILALAGDTPRFYHFRDGRLTAISDAYGNRLRVQRDRLDRIQRLDNGAGRALLLRYEHQHLVAVDYQVYRPADREADAWRTEQTLVTYRYDARQRLIEARNAAGESEHYDYDEQHVILQRQLAGGASFFWAWERAGKAARCIRHWASFAQMEARYTWDDQGSVTVQNSDGSRELYQHDERARLVRRVGLDGGERHTAYDAQGRLIAEQDARGAVTEYRYDEVGRLIARLPPDEAPTAYEYRHGFLHARTRGDATWTYARNAQGDVSALTDPDGQVTRYFYDPQGRLLTVRYPDQSAHRLVWNGLGQLLEETLPDGSQRRFAYDALGRRISAQDEHGAVSRYAWDAVGRLIQTISPSGARRSYAYNAYGQVTAETDELGRVTRFEYADDLHRISRRINPDGSTLNYRYDHAQLLLTAIDNEVGDTYRLDYTPGGLIREETGFDGRRTAYAYDLNGQLSEKTEFGDDGSSLVTQYQRDAAGRLRVKTLPDGIKVEYRYDALGRLLSVDDGQDHPLEFEYDRQDRLTTEHQGWGTLRYAYDSGGRLKRLRLPDGCVLDYQHAPGGALTAIDLNGTRLTRHRVVGGREQQRQQGRLLSDYAYDDQGRLQAHAVRQNQQTLYRRDYAYSAHGNLLQISDSRHGQRHYQYDALDRLTRVRHLRDESLEHFSHDPAGNLLIHNRPGPTRMQGHRLRQRDDSHYDYDAFGNLIRERRGTPAQVTDYRYDSQHRLIGVTTPDGTTASYRYDAFGRRIGKTVDGQTTHFFWQGDQLVAESGPKHYRSYLYEPGSFRPLALLDGKGRLNACPFYYQLDHLGTPQELTSYGGAIVWSARYSAHGQLREVTHGDGEQLDQPLRFQGQYCDAESGLHYNRHRYYHPDLGRYLTPDPVKLAGGLNPYRYTRNPTGWVDPLGLADCPGGDGCKKPSLGERDPTGKTVVDEGDAQLPAYPEEKYLYRGDQRHPDEIFEHGFKPKGTSNDLLLHSIDSNNPPSNFVSTTPDREVGIDFATKFRMRSGFLYTIRPIPGRDLKKELGKKYKFSSEREMAIQNGIKKEDIIGVTPVSASGKFSDYSILNPNRK
ncbi:RHS repeat-associated protein [Pseudomonas sp. S30_BP2TU TE3576]|uniref:RHS repeat-associated core domain-containing protein n=1 Tax=Pseudomonas sp. S30_BP2TU TE3576 TaxID=3349329 RepID=UPI003D2286B1